VRAPDAAYASHVAYTGQRVCNRSKWTKDPDTGKRRQVQRPKSEWIVREDASLRIVHQPLWERVKARQRPRSAEVGEKIKRGLGVVPVFDGSLELD
jgi:hypothetical protein